MLSTTSGPDGGRPETTTDANRGAYDTTGIPPLAPRPKPEETE